MRAFQPRSRAFALLIACAVLVAGGCSSVPRNPDDPLERYNQAMFSFNERVDKAVARPLATIYDTFAPTPVQTGVGNFFGNLGDLWIGFNNFLQGKVGAGLSDWTRFLVNSTFGIFGLLDVASELELQKNDEDFGQTLAVWGVGEGPYVVVPFFGPSTLRDAAVLPLDGAGDPVWRVAHVPTRNSLVGLRIADKRARLLGFEKTLDEGTLDKYTFTRNFHLQQRRAKVHDGKPSLEYEDFEPDEEASLVPAAPQFASDARPAAGRL
ncbi:VacJ family lipoprotein [Azoarcus sp. PA01]|nr:VacJ family lipoprotein [Azoarcus sp. PA01]